MLPKLEERSGRPSTPEASSFRYRLSDTEMSNEDDPTNSAMRRSDERLRLASSKASRTTVSMTSSNRLSAEASGKPWSGLYGMLSTRSSTGLDRRRGGVGGS